MKTLRGGEGQEEKMTKRTDREELVALQPYSQAVGTQLSAPATITMTMSWPPSTELLSMGTGVHAGCSAPPWGWGLLAQPNHLPTVTGS